MKNVFSNIMNGIVSFVKAHTTIAIVTASAVAVTAVAVPVGIAIAKNDNFKPPSENVVSAEQNDVFQENTDTTVSSDKNVSVEETTTVSEPSKETVTQEDVSAPVQTKPQTQTTTSKPAPSQTKPSTPEKESCITVVQRADPDTGISWDGKSPIIYTYPDGTTGTEKRNGATYEYLPGMKKTVIDEEELKEDYDPYCDRCGKKMGDGTKGTCVAWMMGDVDCPNCGEHVPVHTCHTCKK